MDSNQSTSTVTFTLKLFAVYQEAYGTSEIELELPEGTNLGNVLDYVLTEHPHLESWRSLTRFGRNYQFEGPQALVQPGDEIVLIPPVSGG